MSGKARWAGERLVREIWVGFRVSIGGSVRSEGGYTHQLLCLQALQVCLFVCFLFITCLITFLFSCLAGGRWRGDQISRQRWVFTRHHKCRLLTAELVNVRARKHNRWVSGELIAPKISIFQNLRNIALFLAWLVFFFLPYCNCSQKPEDRGFSKPQSSASSFNCKK